MIGLEQRGLFSTSLFNKISQQFLDTLLVNILRDDQLRLKSAKGATGRDFEGKLAEKISQSTDMPYHVHILNGLFPTLKLMEEKFKEKLQLNDKAETLLRCFIVGFTFHDINKLVQVELEVAVENNLEELCEKLEVSIFFPEWKEWLEEIKFLALGAEYRTKVYSLQKPIKEYEFFNTILIEYCHLADSIASIDKTRSVAEFYETLCKRSLDRKPLSTLWQLSYVEIQENIFTLLSQKLLLAVREIILNERQQTILFKLRNGFIYIGEPLSEQEIKKIKISFKSNLSNVIASAQVDFQACKLGFLESLPDEEVSERKHYDQIIIALKEIIKAGFANKGSGSNKIKPLAITNYSAEVERSNQKPEEIFLLEQLLDEYELPIKVIEARKNGGQIQNYFLGLRDEWSSIEEDQGILTLIALEKIKVLSGKSFKNWQDWRKTYSESENQFLDGNFSYEFSGTETSLKTIRDLLPKFSTATERTVFAIISASEKAKLSEEEGEDFTDYLDKQFEEIVSKFATQVKTINTKELDDFIEFYFSGNFERNIESVLTLIEFIPAKNEMCLFTGRPAATKYGAERAFGFTALNFSNRSLNTLKSKDNKISTLFLIENDLRQKELPRGFYTKKLVKEDKGKIDRQFFRDSSKANSAIYYDFGEYFVDSWTQELLNVMGKAMSYDCQDLNGLTIVFEDYAYDFNLYGMNFNLIGDDVESNFYFIYKMLNLIDKTCFRIYATSILTPYHSHKEIFVFENCLPFVRNLGWNTIRIDELKDRLREMKMLLSLNTKRLVTNVLNYAEDTRYLFTAYNALKDEEKPNARNQLVNFLELLPKKEGGKPMSVMNDIAQIAIEMVRPKSGTTSQESWIIRDALKVLKDCYKEGRDEETTIEQIAGELRKTLRQREGATLAKCEPFAIALYKQLFEGEWNKRFPQPNRLRNWVNQFAFLYAEKGWAESRKSKVRGAIKQLEEQQKEMSEDAVIDLLIQENKNLEKYANEYREAFQAVVEQTQA
jgi:hypothetical protein